MKNLKIFFLLLIAGLVVFSCSEEKLNDECAGSDVLAQLDIILGTWEVYTGGNTLEGESEIKSVLGDCAVEENWVSVTGHSAKGLFYIDPRYNVLKQIWITDNPFRPGGVKEKIHTETRENGVLVFTGEIFIDEQKSYLDRTILTPVNSNEFKQRILVSIDRGESWKVIFEGVYKRK